MTFTYSVKSNLSALEYLKTIDNEKMPAIVEKHALSIQANTQANIQREGLIDTGAFLNGIKAEPITERNWQIHDQVDYGVYQELGTSRGIPAHHVLGNACEKEADPFFKDLKEALK